jgi:hypothetical protein
MTSASNGRSKRLKATGEDTVSLLKKPSLFSETLSRGQFMTRIILEMKSGSLPWADPLPNASW